MNKNYLFSSCMLSAGILALTGGLYGCGDTTNITESQKIDTVSSFKKLAECGDENKGEEVYVKDSAALYICVDDSWVAVTSQAQKGEKGDKGDKGDKGENGADGEDGTSCTMKTLKDSSGVELSCDGKVVATIKNGVNGSDGKNGSSCTAKNLKDGSGVELSCDGKVVGTVKNGENGKNCSLEDDGDGSVKVKCGDDEEMLYKAVCGNKPYNPEKQFCYEAELYDCNGKPYNPSKILCDTRDNKEYKVVTIGTQIWMAENLNYADSVKTPSLLKRSWCYGNKSEKCDEYGRLYTWSAAIDSVTLYNKGKGVICGDGRTCNLPENVQGICPDGWHLPSQTEWQVLFAVVGGQGVMAGQVLRAQTGCYTGVESKDVIGLDAYDFKALLGGSAHNGGFLSEGYYAEFWTTTEWKEHPEQAYHVVLPCESAVAGTSTNDKASGFSVRCIRDK